MEKSGDSFDYVLILQPTSPCRNKFHIDEAIEFLESRKADNVVSFSILDHPVEWANTLPSDLSLREFAFNHKQTIRSQDFPVRYYINGAIYIIDIKKMISEHKLFLDDNSFAYIMPKEYSIDIDSKEDFDYAEYCLCKTVKNS